jgi:hypothetical protein
LTVLLVTLAPARASAEVATVVVLAVSAAEAEPWSEGTQAVVAELLSTGFALTVRRAQSTDTDQLSEELRAQLSVASVTGAVAVFRRGHRGIAWVYHRRFGLEQVEMEVGAGPLATSRFVLGVVELLRDVSIDAREAPPPAPVPAPPARARPQRPAPSEAPAPTAMGRAGPLRLWLGGGATLAGGLDGPLPLLSGSAAVGLLPLLGIELTVAVAPSAAKATTSAGEASLRAQLATAFLTFDPLPSSRVGFVLGLGGGVVGASASAEAREGYVARDAASRVGLLSARARGVLTWKRLQLVLTLDPGLLLPALHVTAAGERASLIGRPWLAMSAGIGAVL